MGNPDCVLRLAKGKQKLDRLNFKIFEPIVFPQMHLASDVSGNHLSPSLHRNNLSCPLGMFIGRGVTREGWAP